MKPTFKCLCSHVEEVHNFDPDSAFFGCMYTMLITGQKKKKVEVCRCDEFRPDTLKYVEDVYVKSRKKV